MTPTAAEKKAIEAFKVAIKLLPANCWLFACEGGLAIMRRKGDGSRATTSSGSMDSEYTVDTLECDIDGGGW